MPHADHQWMIIDDMVEIFNRHREEYFYCPSGYVWMNLYHAGMYLGWMDKYWSSRVY